MGGDDTVTIEDARELLMPICSVSSSSSSAASEAPMDTGLEGGVSSSWARCFPLLFSDFIATLVEGLSGSVLEERDRVTRIVGAEDIRFRFRGLDCTESSSSAVGVRSMSSAGELSL